MAPSSLVMPARAIVEAEAKWQDNNKVSRQYFSPAPELTESRDQRGPSPVWQADTVIFPRSHIAPC